MRFDWRKFCDEHKLRYVTQGPNTARNHISVRCPWCGSADHSEHMGLNLDPREPVWGCFRNAEHRGRNPRRLVQRLLSCTYRQALAIIQGQQSLVDDFDAAVDQLQTPTEPTPARAQLTQSTLPRGSKPISSTGYGHHFLNYLSLERGFGPDALMAVSEFRLHYNLAGDWQWRLIVPFYTNYEIVGWTGRDIRKGATLRYRTMEGMSKDLIYNWDGAVDAAADGAQTLWIVEGPFDAMKMHFYGLEHQSAAVGILGTALTRPQIALLVKLLRNYYSQAVVMLDSDMYALGCSLAEELQVLSGRTITPQAPPHGFKDPAELGPQEIQKITTRCKKV